MKLYLFLYFSHFLFCFRDTTTTTNARQQVSESYATSLFSSRSIGKKKLYFQNKQSESRSFLICFKVSDRDLYFHWWRIAMYVFIIQFSFINVYKMFLFHFSSASKTCLFCISKIRSQTWRSTEPHAKNLQRVRFIWRGIGFDRMNVFNIIP